MKINYLLILCISVQIQSCGQKNISKMKSDKKSLELWKEKNSPHKRLLLWKEKNHKLVYGYGRKAIKNRLIPCDIYNLISKSLYYQDYGLLLQAFIEDTDKYFTYKVITEYFSIANCMINQAVRNILNEKLIKICSKEKINEQEDKKEIQKLLDQGADMYYHTRYTSNPLERILSNSKNITIIELFLDNGYNINRRGANDWTLLHCSVTLGLVEITNLLLNHGADVNAYNMLGQTPLSRCAMKGDIVIGEILLQNKAYPNSMDLNNRTPLHFAIMYNQTEMANLLRRYGAKTEFKNNGHYYPNKCLS